MTNNHTNDMYIQNLNTQEVLLSFLKKMNSKLKNWIKNIAKMASKHTLKTRSPCWRTSTIYEKFRTIPTLPHRDENGRLSHWT